MTKARGVTTSFTPLVIASSRLDFLDHYGVPYTVQSHRQQGALGYLRGVDGTARLLWPEMQSGTASIARLDEFPLLAPVLCDAEAEVLLAEIGLEWKACGDILGPSGESVGTIRRATDGSVFIPFDPNLAERVVLTEAYVPRLSTQAGGLARAVARHAYYWIRPALPRTAQMAMRRRFARVQDRTIFPRWPAETALHDLQEWLMSVVQLIAGHPIPQIHWWPEDFEWAVILTHDVERPAGYGRVRELMALEQARGLRSAWYFVPERDYEVEASLLDELRDGGFEVALHGLKHDGRDMTPGIFESRVSAMRDHAEQWGAVGFRAPSTQRGWEQIGQLGLEHDSSYSDVARYEPQPGGSCSWRPFFIGDVVELPITLPMDHTIFDLLEHPDCTVWHEKSDLLRARGGMAMLLTHPDYLAEPHRLDAYAAYLDRIAADAGTWHALPRDASAWWRDRATSRIESADATWIVTGPAADRASVVVHDRDSPFREPRSRQIVGSIALTLPLIGSDFVGTALVSVG